MTAKKPSGFDVLQLSDEVFVREIAFLAIEAGFLEIMVQRGVAHYGKFANLEIAWLVLRKIDFKNTIQLLRELSEKELNPRKYKRFNALLDRVDRARRIRNKRLHAVWEKERGLAEIAHVTRIVGGRQQITLEELRRNVIQMENIRRDLLKFLVADGVLSKSFLDRFELDKLRRRRSRSRVTRGSSKPPPSSRA